MSRILLSALVLLGSGLGAGAWAIENDSAAACVKEYTPRKIVAAFAASGLFAERGANRAIESLAKYYSCAAVAARDPDVCRQLRPIPGSDGAKYPIEKMCRSGSNELLSLAQHINGTGDGLAHCVENVAQANMSSRAEDRVPFCQALLASYKEGDARSLCSKIVPAGRISMTLEECSHALMFLDGDTDQCTRKHSPSYCKERCRAETGLLGVLRKKDPKTCADIPMCAAALSGKISSCKPYALDAALAFCSDAAPNGIGPAAAGALSSARAIR